MTGKRVLFAAFIAVLGVLILFSSVAAQGTGLSPEEELGKSIFFDTNLSINQNQACAACHGPVAGWTGPESTINAAGAAYEGSIAGRFGNRKPPSAAYATLSPVLYMDKKGLFTGGNFWNGRATGEKLGNPAADQAQGPFTNPLEQGLPDSACVVYRVCNPVVSNDYPVSLEDMWAGACAITWPADVETTCATEGATVALSSEDRDKSEAAFDNIARAIAAYEASSEVNAFTSKYDYTFTGQAKLSKVEQKGFALFQGKGKCKSCHISSRKQALFTDFTYDNLGIPKNPENPFYAELAFNPLGEDWIDLGLGGFLETRTDYGAFAEDNMGMQKVPTLRNVGKGSCEAEPDNPDCIVKAYGHNGYFKSLKGIVHFYNTRDVLDTCPGDYTEEQALAANCWPAPEYADTVNMDELGDLGLSPAEEDAIVAFLETLSDGYQP
jgi:cytochrome c peroxidase